MAGPLRYSWLHPCKTNPGSSHFQSSAAGWVPYFLVFFLSFFHPFSCACLWLLKSAAASLTKRLHVALSLAIFLQLSHRSHHFKSLASTSHHPFFWPPADLLPITVLHTRKHLCSWEFSILSSHLQCNILNLLLFITIVSNLSISPKDRSVISRVYNRQAYETAYTYREQHFAKMT